MDRPFTFGIIGGYGATGRVVASELCKSGKGQVLIGGRDRARGEALASELGRGMSAATVDVLKASSLDDFCSQCSIIINCAGPVMLLQDRVAQAAFRNRCHYVDVAGMSLVKEGLLPHSREIENLRLKFVVSAGWMPGISELVPVYAISQARAKMDSIESLKTYFADRGQWSDSALRDGVWFLRKTGLRAPGYFRKGKWTRAKMSESSRKEDLGYPVGRGRFSLYSTPEMEEVGRQSDDCDFFIYTFVSGLRTVAAATLLALLPLPGEFGVRLLGNIFKRNRLPVRGFVFSRVTGRTQGRNFAFTTQIFFKEQHDYWINGIVPTILARMISEGGNVKTGVNFLFDAVDPSAFIEELGRVGVEQTETYAPCE